ncbi:MAG: hypothetical protein ABJB98_07325 [Actinomycetota bacterium]
MRDEKWIATLHEPPAALTGIPAVWGKVAGVVLGPYPTREDAERAARRASEGHEVRYDVAEISGDDDEYGGEA